MYGHPQQPMPTQASQQGRYSGSPPISASQQGVNYQVYPQQPHMPSHQYMQPNGYPPPANMMQQYQLPAHELANNQPRQPHPQGAYPASAYPGKSAALMQPPALNVQEAMDTNSQFFQQRAPMTMSNNQHSEFDTYHQQEENEMWTNEAQIASMFWEQRCMTMLERFQWFYERFEILRNQYISLSEEMQKMDSQEEWHRFQQHHDEFHEKIEEMDQQLSAVLGQNEQLLQQKRTQDSENVWEQRYQQLLGNFKSLQEEMAHMENSGGRGGVANEQYQQLQQHCHELQYQYGQVLNELQKYRQAGMPNATEMEQQMEHQMNEYMQDIEAYKNKLNSLHNENVELQHMLVEIEEQNEELKQEKYKSGVDRAKLQELVKHIEIKEEEIRKLQEEFKNKNNAIASNSQVQAALQQRNREVEQYKRLLSDKQQEANQHRNRLQNVEETAKTKLKEELQNERRSKDKKVNELQRQIDELRSQVGKHGQHSLKADSLEKKLNYVNQQNHNLTQTLKKKNQQLIELRSVTYEIDKLKQMQNEFYKVVEQKEKAVDTLKRKNQQIQLMHQQIQKLTLRIQEISNKRTEYSTRNLMCEIEDLNEQLRRKEAEINKLKNVGELKEEYSQKLEQEVRHCKEKIINLEQLLENERESWRDKEVKLSSRSNQYEKRIKTLDYEFNIQLKETLEKEVAVLRKQNVEKQQIIRQQEDRELLLASKLAIFEKQKDNFDKDLALIKNKERELIHLNETNMRKYKELEQSYRAKEEQMETAQQNQKTLGNYLNNLKLQIQEHNTLIKSKNRTIEQLQNSIATSLSRSDELDKLTVQNSKLRSSLNVTLQQIQKLKFTQDHLSKSKTLSANNSRKQFEKQQSVIVHQLHNENQMLKEQIGKLLQKYTQFSIIPQKDSKVVSVNLNKRLNEFNSKLQLAISGNQNKPTYSDSQHTLMLWEKERKELINHYENELKTLKDQINNFRTTNSQISEQSQLQGSRRQVFYNLETEKIKDEIHFYKEKSRELEERNATLIKVNEELKSKIDSVLKMRQSNTTLDYYKEQCQKIQSENENLKGKLKKLADQNKQYRIELSSKNSKLTQQYQFKILQCQMVIQDLQRKITYLQSQKVAANNEKANLLHDLNLYNLDMEVIKQVQKRDDAVDRVPESPKYTGIQQEFHSVLGNLKNNASPKSKTFERMDSKQVTPKSYFDSQSNYNRSRVNRD